MEDKIGIYIKMINDCIEKYINNDLKMYDLTMTQGRVLAYLHRNKNKGVTQKELEKEFDITHATVSGIITRLETNCFIKVNRNKRTNSIVLLEKSYINEKVIKDQQQKLENIACKGFSEEEKERFVNSLKLVYKNLKEERKDVKNIT